MIKNFEKIEKNKKHNREIVNLFRRENRNINQLNVDKFKLSIENEKLKDDNQTLRDEMNTLRMNSTTTFISQSDIKLKAENAKLINRNVELQNEINSLKITTTSTFSLTLLIDKKDRSVKMSNPFKFNENISNLSYEIWEQLVKDKLIVNVDHFADEYTKATAFIN